jgi:2-polyprenyl-3-methyl-5-hydroxy-6-metoxy-1,4-benzoquinol methylase
MGTDYSYADYTKFPDPSHRPMYLSKLDGHLKKFDVKTVLDAGCGGGDFAEGLHEKGYRVFGVDLNDSAIKAAQQRQVGQFSIASVYDDLLAPFNIKQVDAVVSVEVIEHLYSPRILMTRAHEALRPGGLLAITTPYWGYLKNIALAVSNRMDRALNPCWDGGHIKHFSRAKLTEMATDQGFEYVAFEGCGEGVRSSPYLWSGMLMIFRKPTG